MQKKLAAKGKTSGTQIDYPTIAIPRSIWTAACCIGKAKVLSMAVMTNNHWNKALLEQTEMTVAQLQQKLQEATFKSAVSIFPNHADCTKAANSIILSEYFTQKKSMNWQNSLKPVIRETE